LFNSVQHFQLFIEDTNSDLQVLHHCINDPLFVGIGIQFLLQLSVG
jgi:hypothetical protein